ncbi:autorepressor SdpR family transcription factor [Dethiothermospora halolimnae]|uniref:autorepressor SdpR family transcription factor n=1 Tax=Dethiothermospora halolimnae TaxID=3114390 RepID=UPI003CCBF114
MNKAFKALADPNRRKMLQLLNDKDLTAGEIADYFEISKPSISHHLNILTNAELVLREKKGQNVIYSINTTAFQQIIKWTFDFMERGDGSEEE